MSRAPALQFDSRPPPEWGNQCSQRASLFNDPTWHRVLEKGFAASPLYVWEPGGDAALSISIFRIGPFRIGYVCFPVGGLLAGSLSPLHLEALRLARLPVDVLRIPVSGFEPCLDTNRSPVVVPETAITDLEKWRLEQVPKFRRNVQKAQHANIQPRLLEDVGQAKVLYRLYRDTVLRHDGNLRYTEAYFHAVAELSQNCESLKCWIVRLTDQIDGYLIAALDGHTAYYLHGGMAQTMRQYGGSAILFHRALQWAQQQGARQFNFMSSPPSQPSLVRYKEKMGGVTRLHRTYDLPLSPMRARLFKGALWARDLLG